MDYQNRPGSKPGSGGVAGWSETNSDRRERLRKLALETIDLAKDPYILKNHLGSYECKLCLTLHTNEGSYLSHTQGKKHQANLARRAARDARDGFGSNSQQQFGQGTRPGPMMYGGLGMNQGLQQLQQPNQMMQNAAGGSSAPVAKRQFVKIGRPGYHVTKVCDPTTRQVGLLFKVAYPQISTANDERPRHRFMGAYEQRIEPPNKAYQYVVIAAEPYETIAFRIPSREVDMGEGKFFTYWDRESKQFALQLLFKPC